jgi:STE24 endopeptidase
LVDLGFTALYLLAWLLTGFAQGLRDAIGLWVFAPWLQTALFGLVFGSGYALLSLPLSFYSGYLLPLRFGQSTQGVRGWAIDQVKGAVLGGSLGLAALVVVYAILRAFPESWWLWAAGLLLLFNMVMGILAPVLIYPLFYHFSPLSEEHAGLAERLTRLSEQAGARVQGVYAFDMSRRTRAANAALTGLGATRRIILGDTLLREFTPDEIETILAHELGHHVHRDIPFAIAFETLTTLLGLYLTALALNWGAGAFGLQGIGDIAGLPLFLLVMGLFGLVTMPLSNAFSRWRERLADRYALEMTRKPQAFASAMTRLANQNLAQIDPEPWVEFLLYSHPALAKRIKMARECVPFDQ